MSQFYVGNETDVRRCRESQRHRTSITITGETADGRIRPFRGVVQAMEEDTARLPDRRWRITMRDANAQ